MRKVEYAAKLGAFWVDLAGKRKVASEQRFHNIFADIDWRARDASSDYPAQQGRTSKGEVCCYNRGGFRL